MRQVQLPLPAAVDGFVTAMNAADGAAILQVFADDALVNDIRREFRGRRAIRSWIDQEVIGAKVTLSVMGFREHYGDIIVTGRIDGEYDKTGLPDPLVMTFYFTLRFTTHGDRIVQLIIIHNS
ncbi:MAG: nuclear transport factor 2 family protein [Caulobacteraceae bacterium]